MRVFVDVDLTILHTSEEGWTLRPGAREMLSALREMGCRVYLWTATGREHARRVAEAFDLTPFLDGCLDKDPDLDLSPDLVVDDDPYLVEKYGGVWVRPYREPDPADQELSRALEEIRARLAGHR